MDKLDERLARFLAPGRHGACIPEGVKRFATWAPLLIPYYIPAGPTGTSPGAGRGLRTGRAAGDGLLATVVALSPAGKVLLGAAAVAACTTAVARARWLRRRRTARSRLAGESQQCGILRGDRRPRGTGQPCPRSDYDLSRRSLRCSRSRADGHVPGRCFPAAGGGAWPGMARAGQLPAAGDRAADRRARRLLADPPGEPRHRRPTSKSRCRG